jgi:hypothetical protein
MPPPYAPWLFGQTLASKFTSMGWFQGSGVNLPQMSFPLFDGSNPKLWKSRCETYFDYYVVPMEMWIRVVVMHFQGSALYWLQSMEARTKDMSWN